jgi:hypothetical protein
MKLGCKENHWKIKDGQLVLDTPEGQESVKAYGQGFGSADTRQDIRGNLRISINGQPKSRL